MRLSPSKWADYSLWDGSFWEEYDNSTPRTLQCFEEELITVLKADKKYIQEMISERPQLSLYYDWHESMIPLFEKALAEE